MGQVPSQCRFTYCDQQPFGIRRQFPYRLAPFLYFLLRFVFPYRLKLVFIQAKP